MTLDEKREAARAWLRARGIYGPRVVISRFNCGAEHYRFLRHSRKAFLSSNYQPDRS
jgi:hypothetical protein